MTRKRKPRELRYDARRYKQARADGVCVGCWQRKAVTGRTCCEICLARRRAVTRAWNKARKGEA